MKSTADRESWSMVGIKTTAAVFLIYILANIIYRIWFHPLSRYPGPWLGKFTDVVLYTGVVKENRTFKQAELLRKYGSPFRMRTNELIFGDAQSFQDIYAQSTNPCLKDGDTYPMFSVTGSKNLLNSVERVYSARLRRLCAHSFSINGLLESEDVFANRAQIFLDAVLKPSAGKTEPLDIFAKINDHFLDIASELSFGESFDCVRGKNPTAPADVNAFFEYIPPTSLFPFLRLLPPWLVPSLDAGYRGLQRLTAFSRRNIDSFLAKLDDSDEAAENLPRTNFLRNMATAVDPETNTKLTRDELVENAIIFIVAGAGTTSTGTIGAIYECAKDRQMHEKLTREIRKAFPDRTKVPSYRVASKLPYLRAVIDETLRVWGPLSVVAPRMSPGKSISGVYVPKGVLVGTSDWATSHDPAVFPDPERFVPERWLEASDMMRKMSVPFSLGPRGCIGSHLADVGMVVTLARLFQVYDVELHSRMQDVPVSLIDKGVLKSGHDRLWVTVKSAST